MTIPILGAWEWLSDSHDGRTLFTTSHFCYASAPKERDIPKEDPPSVSEAAALARSFGVAVAGSVSVAREGHEWRSETVHWVNLVPDYVGHRETNMVWLEGDRLNNQGFGPDGTRGPVPPLQYRRLSALGESPLAGAWQLVSPDWDGLMLLTDQHYRYVVTRKDRPALSTKRRALGDEEAAALYHSFDAQCGSYAVDGTTILRIPVVAKNPRDKGRTIAVAFALGDGQLTTGNDGRRAVWRKLEPVEQK